MPSTSHVPFFGGSAGGLLEELKQGTKHDLHGPSM